MTQYSQNPVSPVMRLVVVLGLLAITLFVAGPQLGSLDADQDGFPEVPVVVGCASPILAGSNLEDECWQALREGPALALKATRPNISTVPGSERIPKAIFITSTLRSIVVLRC